ncbi:DEAD-box ATP-dependent RNA helicase 20 [Durio zibethinus]|uniref:DEAD-box ATP-dependent RNA helicase 20 n=1 Tax=Durio zibethinus TaxID=66656 RepID=A0A6P6AKZ5_DURZI|nr:DEAD-box ATP-dependent RNA helicase 20 [Durio zibethinus]
MAKGDDAVRRKKNKAQRKKLNRKNDSSSVSAQIASIIAAKKRRKAGQRRICQGMCFSLPTPDDPFNDRLDKKDLSRRETNKTIPSKLDRKISTKGKDTVPTNGSVLGDNGKADNLGKISEKVMALKDEHKKSVTLISNVGKTRHINSGRMGIQPDGEVSVHGHQEQSCESSDCPSKYLILCLKAIEDALHHDGTYNGEKDKPLFVNTWGIEFWKCYSAGKDILDTSGSSSDVEQIAWVVSTAADAISRREKEGLSFTSPFLLFLVSSKEKALEVRSFCKPLKAQGIHTVSLHPGASIDHQISGLQSCEPEFLISTPERLWQLVSLKAIDISGVSMLVIDGMESLSGGCFLKTIKSIKQAISGKPHTLVFSKSFSNASISAVQNLLKGLVYRLSLNDSVASQSACIIQSIHVCSSKEEKIRKGIHALENAYCNYIIPQAWKVLYIVGKHNDVQKLVSAVKFKGYSVSASSYLHIMEFENSLDCGSRMRPSVSIIDIEHISSTALEQYGVVIIPDFVVSIDDYVQILTRMARHTVNGVLHSFLTKEDAQHARPLIDILEQCGQTVPEALRNLCYVDQPC